MFLYHAQRSCEFEVPPSQVKAQIQHSRAKTCTEKMKKYTDLYEDYKTNQLASNNLSAYNKDIPEFGIVPFIVDLVGFIHPVSLKFLQSIADRAKGILIGRVTSINSQKPY
jgi:hypothetical protein